MTTDKFTTWQRATLAAISAVYVLVRFWGLTQSCLWFDEIFGVHAAEHSWGEMFRFVSLDLIHPPLFYAALKLWTLIGGESLFVLRLLPMIFSVLALPPFLYWCRELKLKFSATAVALVLFSANGALIKYAQEVRMYSLLLFLACVSLWLFSRFFYRGKNIWVLTLVNTLLVYTHYFGWLLIVAEVLAILLFQRIKIRHVLMMFGLNMLAFVPWLVTLWNTNIQVAEIGRNIGWIQPPTLVGLLDFALDVVEPFYYQQSTADPRSIYFISIPLLLVLGIALGLYFCRFGEAENKTSLYLMGLFAAIPICIAFVTSWILPFSVWGSRHLILVFPPFMVLAAIFVTEAYGKTLRSSLLLIVLAAIIVAAVLRAESPPVALIWCEWNQLAEGLKGKTEENLYVFEDLIAYHFWFATHGSGGPPIIKVNGLPGITEDKAYFLPRGFEEVKVVGPEPIDRARVWLVFRDASFDETRQPLKFFAENGYKFEPPSVVEAQGIKTFLVEASR